MGRATDPAAAARQSKNLLRGASPNPEARKRQLANLKSTNLIRHGSYSETELAPLRESNLEALRARFPTAPDAGLWTHANRGARMAKIAAFLDDAGPLKLNGDLWPSAIELTKLEAAHERREQALEATYGKAAEHPGAALALVVAEIEAARDAG
jgi:hypothetical protein